MMIKKIVFLMFLSTFYLGQAQEILELSSKSTLTIDGTSTIHDWMVTANEMSGKVTKENNLPKTISFEVSVDKILSERGPTMDNKMHNALLKDKYPKIVFVLTAGSNSKMLKGKLKVAGHEKTIEIPVEMSLSNSSYNIKGAHTIALKDYGMEPPTAMYGQIVVGDEVTVKFDLEFIKR